MSLVTRSSSSIAKLTSGLSPASTSGPPRFAVLSFAPSGSCNWIVFLSTSKGFARCTATFHVRFFSRCLNDAVSTLHADFFLFEIQLFRLGPGESLCVNERFSNSNEKEVHRWVCRRTYEHISLHWPCLTNHFRHPIFCYKQHIHTLACLYVHTLYISSPLLLAFCPSTAE